MDAFEDILENILVDQIHGLYNSEKQIVRSIPKMMKRVRSSHLRDVLRDHFIRSRNQIERLQRILAHFGESAREERSTALEEMLGEAVETIDEIASPQVKDTSLIQSLQRIEHYEIASYGTARTLAHALGYRETAGLLGDSLEEERMADEELTWIADLAFGKVA